MLRSEEALERLGRQEPDGPCVSRYLCFALLCLHPRPAQPPITTSQSRDGEHHRAPSAASQVQYSCSNPPLLAVQAGSEESNPDIRVVRPLDRVSPHCALWSPREVDRKQKKVVREGDREGIDENGVIAQTVTRELLSYPFHSDTALR